jgi:hypothetical protein
MIRTTSWWAEARRVWPLMTWRQRWAFWRTVIGHRLCLVRLVSSGGHIEWGGLDDFNLSCPFYIRVVHYWGPMLRLWNLFRHVYPSLHCWGFGVFQIARRHLFFVGDQGDGRVRVCVLFVGKTE